MYILHDAYCFIRRMAYRPFAVRPLDVVEGRAQLKYLYKDISPDYQ